MQICHFPNHELTGNSMPSGILWTGVVIWLPSKTLKADKILQTNILCHMHAACSIAISLRPNEGFLFFCEG